MSVSKARDFWNQARDGEDADRLHFIWQSIGEILNSLERMGHTPACEFDQAHGYECTCAPCAEEATDMLRQIRDALGVDPGGELAHIRYIRTYVDNQARLVGAALHLAGLLESYGNGVALASAETRLIREAKAFGKCGGAGDACGVGNECGRAGCQECQQ